jgi:hypothetical protein
MYRLKVLLPLGEGFRMRVKRLENQSTTIPPPQPSPKGRGSKVNIFSKCVSPTKNFKDDHSS